MASVTPLLDMTLEPDEVVATAGEYLKDDFTTFSRSALHELLATPWQ